MFHNIDIMEYYQKTLRTHIARFCPGVMILFGLCCVSSAIAQAQQAEFDTNPKLPANAVRRISEHVYAISAFPNIGIVIGDQASLVIDTGLGPRNGEAGFPATSADSVSCREQSSYILKDMECIP